MSELFEKREEGVDTLRCRMEADARFKRVFSGYDPNEVRAYVEHVKEVFAQQTKAAKQEQESLIFEMDSAKSEIKARNYAITTMKETLAQREEQLGTANARIATLVHSVRALKEALAQREAQLSAANTRITVLVQSAQAFESEREKLGQFRAMAEKARVAAERAQTLENEAVQLKDSLAKAGHEMETWKAERERFLEENTRLRRELDYLRGMAPVAVSEQDYGWNSQPVYTQQRQAPVEQTSTDSRQAVFSQIIDKLSDTFAEAYTLVNQLRSAGEPQQETTVQPRPIPRMQVLRPEGLHFDYTGRK